MLFSERLSSFKYLSKRCRFALFTLFLIVSGNALAAPKVDSSVESIISAGWWESGGESGFYRIIVWNTGFEHVSSGVTVEWVSGPKRSDDEAKIVHSSELLAPGSLSIGRPKVTRLMSKWSRASLKIPMS